MNPDFVDAEMASLNLNDARRTRRAKDLMRAIALTPSDSFPEIFDNHAELEACYRLQNSDHVDHEHFISAHRDATWNRALSDSNYVLILHDTTEVVYPISDEPRYGLTQKGATQSYHAHVALAVPEGPVPHVHGVVGLLPTILEDGTWLEITPEDDEKALDCGSHRWSLLARDVHSVVPKNLALIHVMDREADDYVVFSELATHSADFVVRSRHNRRLEDGAKLWTTVNESPILGYRKVDVSKRGGKRLPGSKKSHPDRRHRGANLTLRAVQVRVKIPSTLSGKIPLLQPLWCVEAVEEHPPKGEAAVHWRLLSTLPAQNEEQALRIVDIYRKRWLIEEFFKALKTGCALTKRQARSRATLLTILGMTIPLAWRLLSLRALERESPKTPASDLFDNIELMALKKLVPKARLTKHPNLSTVLKTIAQLGGHQKNNGPPGWLTLGRGMEKLLNYAKGWRDALEFMEQSGLIEM